MDEWLTVEYARRRRQSSMETDHFHTEYEIYFLVSGSVEYFIDGSLYQLTAGSFALIPPGMLHRTVKYKDGAQERILIMLDPRFLTAFSELDASLFDCFDRFCVLVPSESEQYANLLRLLCREYQRGKPNGVLLRAYMAQLLVLLGREDAVPRVPYAPDDIQTRRILEAVAYINEHYADDIDRGLLCRRIFISPSHFSRLFKQVTGFTYVEYLRTVRLKNAARLLTEGKRNVTGVAAACGFSSSNHFCKQFKAAMGMSPLQYQKKYETK